jgi:hypothetical protein
LVPGTLALIDGDESLLRRLNSNLEYLHPGHVPISFDRGV